MNICILGISFCGSTLLSYILGANKDIFSVGESSWVLYTTKNSGQSKERIERANKCKICQKCNFWTPEFKRTLTYSNFFDSIKKRAKEKYNVDKIVYADKNHNQYNKFLKYGNQINKVILLFKRPEGFVTSYFYRDSKWSIKQILDLYCWQYTANLKFIEGIDTQIIFYDDFALNPKKIVKELCNWLEVSYSDEMLEYWNRTSKTHQIAGNANPLLNFRSDERFEYWTDKWRRKSRKKIILDDKWKTELSKEILEEIKENKMATSLFNKLLSLRTIK